MSKIEYGDLCATGSRSSIDMMKIPSSAWFASSGPVSFSNMWIVPVPTEPADRQSSEPRCTMRSGGMFTISS